MKGGPDVDNIIERLLSVRGNKPGKTVDLTSIFVVEYSLRLQYNKIDKLFLWFRKEGCYASS